MFRYFISTSSIGLDRDKLPPYRGKKKVVSRQPIFIVNLKSNTMKNTLQI